jgi:hypothetical protein
VTICFAPIAKHVGELYTARERPRSRWGGCTNLQSEWRRGHVKRELRQLAFRMNHLMFREPRRDVPKVKAGKGVQEDSHLDRC